MCLQGVDDGIDLVVNEKLKFYGVLLPFTEVCSILTGLQSAALLLSQVFAFCKHFLNFTDAEAHSLKLVPTTRLALQQVLIFALAVGAGA